MKRIIEGLALRVSLLAAFCGLASGCGSSGGSDDESVARAMQRSMQADLTELWSAAKDLQAAAPTPSGRGWDKAMDAAAIASMKAAWVRARTAYEHVEGATAPVFPDVDVAIDERYDGFLATLGAAGDPDPFDDHGVTGMHAIERILYADTIPAGVVTFEATLPGYKAAAFPATEQEAAAFKDQLCGRLVDDTKGLLDAWTPVKIDISGSFQGLIGLVNEQQEKVNKASTDQEESRYSQRTMADLRANLAGTQSIYGLFREWLKKQPAMGPIPNGVEVDASITEGLAALGTLYETVPGDAIPQPPPTWRAEHPSDADLETPFGKLYAAIHDAVNPEKPDSLVSVMNQGAQLLGLPGFVE
jgi:iron uptake system component EfeO